MKHLLRRLLLAACQLDDLRQCLPTPSEDFRRDFATLEVSLAAAVDDLERLAFAIYRAARRPAGE